MVDLEHEYDEIDQWPRMASFALYVGVTGVDILYAQKTFGFFIYFVAFGT